MIACMISFKALLAERKRLSNAAMSFEKWRRPRYFEPSNGTECMGAAESGTIGTDGSRSREAQRPGEGKKDHWDIELSGLRDEERDCSRSATVRSDAGRVPGEPMPANASTERIWVTTDIKVSGPSEGR